MKKRKRILAWTAVILLAALYLSTFIFALIDSPWSYDLFKLCLGFSIIIPVLFYVYLMIYRLQSKKEDNGKPSHD